MRSASLDAITKSLLRESGREVVAWLAGRSPLETRLVPTETLIALSRTADHLLRATFPGEPTAPHYFHVEIQTAGDPDMGFRMLEYWVRVKRHFLKTEGRPVPVSSFVIYLDRAQYRKDSGDLDLRDGSGTECRFRYRVLKLWELDPETLFRLGAPGLLPLAPLMKSPDPKALVLESKKRILKADPRRVPRRRKADLLGALAVFAGLVVKDEQILYKILLEELMGLERSLTAQIWMRMGREEGMEKGIEKGIRVGKSQALRDALLAVLSSRFRKVEKRLQARIQRIDEPPLLRKLIKRAAVVPDLRQFARELTS